MLDLPFFSVITPNYNSSELAIRAIKSLEHNFVSYEHIIIDDASTDLDVKHLNEYLNRSKRKNIFQINNIINKGPGASRNDGLVAAQGKYIIFLDADDEFSPHGLDKLYDTITQNSCPDVVVFRYEVIKKHSKQQSRSLSPLDTSVTSAEALRDLILDNIISAPWGKAISANVAKGISFPDLTVQEDSIYNLKVFTEAKTFFYLNEVLYSFDKSFEGSLTTKPFNDLEAHKFYESWLVFEKTINEVEQELIKDKWVATRKIRFCVIYYVARLAMHATDKNEARKTINLIRRITVETLPSAFSFLSIREKAICFICLISPWYAAALLRKIR